MLMSLPTIWLQRCTSVMTIGQKTTSRLTAVVTTDGSAISVSTSITLSIHGTETPSSLCLTNKIMLKRSVCSSTYSRTTASVASSSTPTASWQAVSSRRTEPRLSFRNWPTPCALCRKSMATHPTMRPIRLSVSCRTDWKR